MRLACAFILGLLAFLAAVWGSGTTQSSAHMPHPGLNFYLSVEGVPGCDTAHGDATCTLTADSHFTVSINLALPPDIPTYVGYDTLLSYTGVQPQGQPSTAVWPECAFPVVGRVSPSDVGFGCAVGVAPAPPSTYQGPIGTMNFTCAGTGAVVLHNDNGDTILVAPADSVYGQDDHTDPTPLETLTINCSSAGPTPVPTPTPSAPTPVAVNPETLTQQLFDAANRGDLAQALTFFADDAVVQGYPDCASPCRGPAIQQAFQAITSAHLHVTITNSEVSGIVVYGLFQGTSDALREVGIDRILGEFNFQLRGDRIAFGDLYLTRDDSQTARFIAQYTGQSSPASAGLPDTGSRAPSRAKTALITLASLIAGFGVLTLLVGVGTRGISRHSNR